MNEDRKAVAEPKTLPSSLGQRTVRGFSLMFLAAAWGKVQGAVVQVALAWLLSKEDFGKIGLAYTVSAFANLIVNPGLSTVLVQRSKRLRYWATPAFWMSLTCAAMGSLLMVGFAPVGARLYNLPELVGLVTVLAIAAPIGALSVLPNAFLNSQLRFKFIATLSLCTGLLTGGLTILFASLNFGAYSFVLPLPIVNAVQAVAVWSVTRLPIRMKLQLRRWRFLFGNARWMFVYLLCWTAIGQGDYMVLGLFFDPSIVGVYFFGFNLAMQGARFIGGNLHTVLYPSLVALGTNNARQADIVVEASRHLALTVGLASTLQAVLAGPVLHLAFGPRWNAAIPVVQLLSIGVAFESMSSPGALLLLARGRFKAFALVYVFACAVFFAFVCFGAKAREEVGVAAAVACYYVSVWVPTYCLIMRWAGVSFRTTTRVFLSATFAGGLAAAAGLGLSALVLSDEAHGLRAALLLIIVPFVFYSIMWKLEPQSLSAAWARFRQLRDERPPLPEAQG